MIFHFGNGKYSEKPSLRRAVNWRGNGKMSCIRSHAAGLNFPFITHTHQKFRKSFSLPLAIGCSSWIYDYSMLPPWGFAGNRAQLTVLFAKVAWLVD